VNVGGPPDQQGYGSVAVDPSHPGTIMVGTLNRQYYSCSPQQGYSYNHMEDFRIGVQVGSIKPSGQMPPPPPYAVGIKTWSTSIPFDCSTPNTFNGWVHEGTSINSVGYTVVMFSWMDANYLFPCETWPGGPWDRMP